MIDHEPLITPELKAQYIQEALDCRNAAAGIWMRWKPEFPNWDSLPGRGTAKGSGFRLSLGTLLQRSFAFGIR